MEGPGLRSGLGWRVQDQGLSEGWSRIKGSSRRVQDQGLGQDGGSRIKEWGRMRVQDQGVGQDGGSMHLIKLSGLGTLTEKIEEDFYCRYSFHPQMGRIWQDWEGLGRIGQDWEGFGRIRHDRIVQDWAESKLALLLNFTTENLETNLHGW